MTDVFFRQVHPLWFSKGGELQSRSFVPTKKDEGKLSVDDSNKTTAEDSFRHFTEDLALQSAGTWAVSIEEIEEHEDLVCEASPQSDNPAHCSLDYNKVSSKGQIKRIGQILADKASKRGCLFEA